MDYQPDRCSGTKARTAGTVRKPEKFWPHPLTERGSDPTLDFVGLRHFAPRELTLAMELKFRPKLDKIVELLLYLAHTKAGADKYQAVKLFYLADKLHLNRFGRPITQEVYYALPYGPVASITMDLLEGDRRLMREAGIEELPFKIAEKQLKNTRVPALGEPRRAVNYNLFSKSDIKVFDEIVQKYGEATFDDLFQITHDHYAYVRAWNSRRPNSKRAAMRYEDMIDDEERRRAIVEDIGPVSEFME